MNKYLKYILHAAVLAGLALAAFKYLNGGDVVKAFRTFDYGYAPALVGLAALYLALQSFRFALLLRPLANTSWGTAMRAYASGQAMTLLPGGVAGRAALLKQAGVPYAKGAVPVLFSSGLNQALLLLGSLVAALWIPRIRTPVLIILAVVAVLAALLLIPATRHWLSNTIGKLAARFDQRDVWDSFTDALGDTLTPRWLLAAVGVTVVAVATKVAMLWLALAGAGAAVAIPTAVLAFMLPTMLGRLSGLPGGGVGVTEAAMIGFLTTSGVNSGAATAAVALFRISAVLVPALLGALVYTFAWSEDDEGDEAAEGAENGADEPTAEGAQGETATAGGGRTVKPNPADAG